MVAPENWWDNFAYVDVTMGFTPSEVARIPWARLAGRRSAPQCGLDAASPGAEAVTYAAELTSAVTPVAESAPVRGHMGIHGAR